ncbi:MAG: PfkB family carbohydrate kinase [Fuerstiella sp.]|nr:PfkB family carbohydrate kinase [Fuerstiella sp.]
MSSLLSPERLKSLVECFSDCRIAVVGDFFLDKYLDIDPCLEEPSVETGKPARQVASVRCFPGAAGTVVSNLSALGAGTLHAAGFTGDDGEAWELRRGLTAMRCSTEHLHVVPERFTPTYTKPRNMSVSGLDGEYSRIDIKNRQTTPTETEHAIIASITDLVSEVDAVIVMDQVEARNCGAVTAMVREHLGTLAENNPDVIFWADSRRRIREYRNVITKPNEFELTGNDDPVPGDTVDAAELQSAAAQLRTKTGAPVFVTCGANGMFVTDPQWTAVPGIRLTGEIDTTGAGDSVTAGCVLALCSGASCEQAAVVGNLVASVTVRQLATTGTACSSQLGLCLQTWLEQVG